MARVTVEDCVDKVPNRFDLVLLSAHRAREISGGSELTVDSALRNGNLRESVAAFSSSSNVWKMFSLSEKW